jgi:hypothetical protein
LAIHSRFPWWFAHVRMEFYFTNTFMTKFKIFLLKWICKAIVIQGPRHKKNIIEYYRILREAARNEFTEDNDATLDEFLNECHKLSSVDAWKIIEQIKLMGAEKFWIQNERCSGDCEWNINGKDFYFNQHNPINFQIDGRNYYLSEFINMMAKEIVEASTK